MTQPPLPLLAGFDFTALAWAAFWSLMFSATRLPARRRWQARSGQAMTPWWVVLLETMVGGLVGGVLLAVGLPEYVPEARGPGKQAALAVVGAALGPYIGQWVPQVAAWWAEKKIGVKLVVQERKEEGDDGEKAD